MLPALSDSPASSPAQLYQRMATIRRFEQAAYRGYEQGEVFGTVHVGIGQEAVATGVMSALEPHDLVFSHHRGHAHALAKGVDPRRLMAELFGKATGVSHGKGGSMHSTDVESGFLGTLAVVGGSIPVSVGVALAHKLAGDDAVCVVFFGDGAVNQGVLYESLNLAAIWSVPVIMVCENNSYAISTPARYSTAGPGVVDRAAAFGVRGEVVDGQDVLAVHGAAQRAVALARAGEPVLLECLTYRFMGHSRGDPAHGPYRTKDELEEWRARDPLTVLAATAGMAADEIAHFEGEAKRIADEAYQYAASSPRPDESALTEDVRG